MVCNELPLPPHFDAQQMDTIWKVPYQERMKEALEWSQMHQIRSAVEDDFKIGLILVDIQNTFCIPDFELYVGGRSGTGAIDDNRRLCEFIYRNIGVITEISATMDTHTPMQIFHAIFLVDDEGNHPDPMTLVSAVDVQSGRWRFNPALAGPLGIDVKTGQRYLQHYTAKLQEHGKYDLTIWPYHAMLGGIGHALVSSVEEAIFFHSIARYSRPDFIIKGDNPLTEHYSAIGPEVLDGPDGTSIAQKDDKFIEKLRQFEIVAIAGQAKSHCLAWTINDLLDDIQHQDKSLVQKVYVLEDCTSAVVIPGVVDYTYQADAAFKRFADAGMHMVSSTNPIGSWPGIRG
jgi:nicotinamidase-related amidase